MASTEGSKAVWTLLLEKELVRSVLGTAYSEIVREAVYTGQAEIVQLLMDQAIGTCNPDALKEAFLLAARKGYTSTMEPLVPELQLLSSYKEILDQALHVACVNGLREPAELLANLGADINKTASETEYETETTTALQACLRIPAKPPKLEKLRDLWPSDDYESVIDLLLQHGAAVNQTGSFMVTPLHIAVQYRTQQVVCTLISHGANVNAYVQCKRTLLQCAAAREIGSLPIIRILLEAGASIILQNNEQCIQQACPVLNSALDFFDGCPDENGRFKTSTSIEEILSTGPGAVFKLLLLSQPSLRASDPRFSLLLQIVATMGDCDFTKFLIERNVDVNLCGHHYGCVLQAAARHGHLDCLRLLLDAGSQVNIIGGQHKTPLQAAIVGAHENTVEELILHGAEVNLKKERSMETAAPLQLAVESGNPKIARLLLAAGADIHSPPDLLHLAVNTSSYEMTQIVIEFEAKTDHPGLQHTTALIAACMQRRKDIAELLLSNGVDINADGPYELLGHYGSALPAACWKGDHESAKLLLENGAHVEKQSHDKWTPLEVVAFRGHVEIMDLLLESGAKVYNPSQETDVLRRALEGEKSRQSFSFLVQVCPDLSQLSSACGQTLSAANGPGLRDEKMLLLLINHLPPGPWFLKPACRFGFRDAAKAILARGISPNADLQDESGSRALHVAAYHQQEHLVLFLIGQGVDVHCVTPRYGSPVSAVMEGLVAYE